MPEPESEIAIVRIGGGWHVLSRNQRSGRFDYRVDAEEAALTLCRKERDAGMEVKLVVQDANGELRPLETG
jgi:hypothetical protein